MMPLYRIGVAVLGFMCKICGVKVLGRENIPQGDIPLVVVGNHSSYADPIFVGYALLPRQVYFVAKKEFSQKFFLGTLFKKLGAIFVDRNEADIIALKSSVKVLKENKVLGIFAEGKRYKGNGLTDFKQGPVFIAYKGNAPIIPVGIKNPSHIFWFWRRDAYITIGKPIYIDKQAGELHEIMNIYTEKLREAVGDLI